MSEFKSQLEGLKSVGKAYILARNVPDDAFETTAEVFTSHRKKTIRTRAAVPLVALLARRARSGDDWDVVLDASVDLKSAARNEPYHPAIIDDICAVIEHLPEERARPLVEPHLGPKSTFPTGLLAFRMAGLVPLEHAAFSWLRRVTAASDLEAWHRLHWLADGIACQAAPEDAVVELLSSHVERGMDPMTGAGATGRPELVRFLANGMDAHSERLAPDAPSTPGQPVYRSLVARIGASSSKQESAPS